MAEKKVAINKVAEVCKKNAVEPHKLRDIVEELQTLVAPKDEVPNPHEKKQFVVVIFDVENKLPVTYQFEALVVQIPEDAGPHTAVDRIIDAAHDFNRSKKGRMLPVKSIGEAAENVTGKFFVEKEVWIKTKSPVYVIPTNNELPERSV